MEKKKIDIDKNIYKFLKYQYVLKEKEVEILNKVVEVKNGTLNQL